jgi:hypothetical protein
VSAPVPECLSRLEAQLREDARAGTPPWASPAVASAPGCGAEGGPWLRGRLGDDEIGFLALEALRVHFPAEWAGLPPGERAAVYARELGAARWYNAWGLPGQPPSDAGRALMQLGPAAIPHLSPLLDSRRPAPSFGSEEASMSRLMAYRVCDYAWDFIARIQGGHPELPDHAGERDAAISAMQERLRAE